MEGELPSIVASKIRGPKDTTVRIKVFRNSIGDFLEFSIVRAKIEISNVNYTSLGDGIYKINVTQFVDESI